MTLSLPLAGLKIVVTRPRDQAGQMMHGIEQAGGTAILFPLLEISPISDPAPLNQLAARLHEFNLAIFISPNAVRYGMAAIRTAGALLPEALKVATVGLGSEMALRKLGVANVMVPAKHFDSEGLLALPALQDVRGWRIAIFRGNGGRELLGDTLKARGAQVEYATCYQRAKPTHDVSELLEANADALTVTSSEAFAHLWSMLDEPARKRLAEVPLFVPHERIGSMARAVGWGTVVPTANGDEGMLAGLIAWANSREK
jgi:uroporphyrinogen-III synthase